MTKNKVSKNDSQKALNHKRYEKLHLGFSQFISGWRGINRGGAPWAAFSPPTVNDLTKAPKTTFKLTRTLITINFNSFNIKTMQV